MTKDEISRLTFDKGVKTFYLRVEVCGERDGKPLDQLKSDSSWHYFACDSANLHPFKHVEHSDLARWARHCLARHLITYLEKHSGYAEEPAWESRETYRPTNQDNRQEVAERARWAAWRLAHPERGYDADGQRCGLSASADRKLLAKLWKRMLELEGMHVDPT